MKRYKEGGDIENMSEEELTRRSGEQYDKIMPSPEPGEAAPKQALPPTGAGAGRGFVNPKNATEKPKAARAPKKLAKGGSASSRADGIAQRGKTRGMIV
jgi:FtsP/CotA-like multicopper oxidase with cupredoxin domain